MRKPLICSCGGNMRLNKRVDIGGRDGKVFLCDDCHLAYSPYRQWCPDLKEWYYKLPNGWYEKDLDLSEYTEYYQACGRYRGWILF